MLARLSPAILDRLDFPLGGLEKPRVRQIARDARLPVAERPESQDLCFLAGTSGPAFRLDSATESGLGLFLRH